MVFTSLLRTFADTFTRRRAENSLSHLFHPLLTTILCALFKEILSAFTRFDGIWIPYICVVCFHSSRTKTNKKYCSAVTCRKNKQKTNVCIFNAVSCFFLEREPFTIKKRVYLIRGCLFCTITKSVWDSFNMRRKKKYILMVVIFLDGAYILGAINSKVGSFFCIIFCSNANPSIPQYSHTSEYKS